ncbi:DNA-binding transcriptional regulator BolA [Buchnera aphidicola (Eriosoma grossulariae)]
MIEIKIKKLIKDTIKTNLIKILNHSDQHQKKNKNILITHLTIIIVSQSFLKQSLLNRHRTIQNIIHKNIQPYIYSISLYTYTQQEWEKINKNMIYNTICIQKKS